MPLTFKEYQKNILGKFKQKIIELNRNIAILSILAIITLCILLYTIINEYVYYQYQILWAFIINVFCFMFGYGFAVLLKKPLYKEYLMYYLWMGTVQLEKFEKEERPKNLLKKSKYFFKQLYIFIDSKILKKSFDKDKIRNKSLFELKLITNKFIYPKLKMDIKSIDCIEIQKIANNTLSDIYDEDFEKLHNFLEPYVKDYYPKKVTFTTIINKFKSSSLLFYSSILLSIMVVIIIGTWTIFYLGYDWNVAIGVYTAIGLVIAVIAFINSIFHKPSK